MANEPPADMSGQDCLTITDKLAVDRTLLANERTLLAYLRAGVALIIAGVSMIHFSQEGWFHAIGIVSIPAGIVMSVIGLIRFRRMNSHIAHLQQRTTNSRIVQP